MEHRAATQATFVIHFPYVQLVYRTMTQATSVIHCPYAHLANTDPQHKQHM